MRPDRDPLDAGCLSACSAVVACIVGSVFSSWMVYITALLAILPSALFGKNGGVIAWHISMGAILLGSLYVIIAFLDERTDSVLYQVMITVGFTIGYAGMWMLFAFGDLR